MQYCFAEKLGIYGKNRPPEMGPVGRRWNVEDEEMSGRSPSGTIRKGPERPMRRT